jgi:dTDP-4-amino-4,6-dideoxygalactose transaminase
MRLLPPSAVLSGVRVLLRGELARYSTDRSSEASQFEVELAKLVGVERALGLNSGTSGLICALVGVGVGPGDEVLVPAYTWVSSAASVLAVGAIPILVEIDRSLTIDPADIARKITPHTKAIIPVHMQNMPSAMDAIMAVAKQHRLAVIEDACQAVGVTYKGRALGSIGDVGVFSYQQYKNIYSGEGGALVTNDGRIYTRARMYHDVGSYTRLEKLDGNEPLFAGVNLRMPELSAAILRPQLKLLAGKIEHLKTHRRLALQRLRSSRFAARFEVSPHHDPEAAAGLSVYFDEPEDARAFAGASRGVTRLIETGRHVYTNWESLKSKRAAHPSLDPWTWAHRPVEFTPETCPRTLEILARTCLIPLRLEMPTLVYRAWLLRSIP